MFTQIVPIIPPAVLNFYVFSNFLALLSPNELFGFKLLQTAPANVVAQEPLGSEKDWRRSEGGQCCPTLVISNVNRAGIWGGGLQSRLRSSRLVLSKASLPERQEGCSWRKCSLGWVWRHHCAFSSCFSWARTSQMDENCCFCSWISSLFCSVSGDGTWLLRSRRDLCFEGLWCLLVHTSANSP